LSEQELLDALRDVLVEKLKVDGTKVQLQANLYDDLGLDSIRKCLKHAVVWS
jgi:acyl carrier protein